VTGEEALVLVRRVLCAEFEFEAGEISEGTHLVDDLDLDSVDAAALAIRLEEESDLELAEEELRELRTVADLAELVRRRSP
jgi:acyl carrier protein